VIYKILRTVEMVNENPKKSRMYLYLHDILILIRILYLRTTENSNSSEILKEVSKSML